MVPYLRIPLEWVKREQERSFTSSWEKPQNKPESLIKTTVFIKFNCILAPYASPEMFFFF